jgi:hypothetical protein
LWTIQTIYDLYHRLLKVTTRNPQAFEDTGGVAAAVVQQAKEEMFGANLTLCPAVCFSNCLFNGRFRSRR